MVSELPGPQGGAHLQSQLTCAQAVEQDETPGTAPLCQTPSRQQGSAGYSSTVQ